MKKLTGNTDIEDKLERLDKLTQEEARMASAELLKITHGVDDRVKGVDEKVQAVRGAVHDVRDKVQGVEGKVQDVNDDVQGVRGDMQDLGNKVQDVEHRVRSIGSDISSRVRAVDNKLDQVNCSLLL